MIFRNYPVLFFIVLLLPVSDTLADNQAIIEDAWIADAPPIAQIRAGYLKLHNKGDQAITIKSFSSPDFKRIELHKTVVAEGMVKMEEVRKLSIEPGQYVEFKPGGYHLMLFNPKRKLARGDKVKFQLQLHNNKTSTFQAVVRQRGDNMDHRHEHHHKCGGKCGGK